MGSRKDLGNIISKARYSAGLSQEELAIELGKSRSTIQNWEKGLSFPDLFDTLEIFNILKLNPVAYILEYTSPDTFSNLTKDSGNLEIENALNELMTDLSVEQKRAILYLFYGSYNGDANAMLQLFLAQAHLPLMHRISIANQICELYKLCEKRKELNDVEHIMPNIPVLESAINRAKNSAELLKEGY